MEVVQNLRGVAGGIFVESRAEISWSRVRNLCGVARVTFMEWRSRVLESCSESRSWSRSQSPGVLLAVPVLRLESRQSRSLARRPEVVLEVLGSMLESCSESESWSRNRSPGVLLKFRSRVPGVGGPESESRLESESWSRN